VVVQHLSTAGQKFEIKFGLLAAGQVEKVAGPRNHQSLK
jgi:hypothetical protein